MKHAGEKTKKKHIYSRTSKRKLKTKKPKLEHIVVLREKHLIMKKQHNLH